MTATGSLFGRQGPFLEKAWKRHFQVAVFVHPDVFFQFVQEHNVLLRHYSCVFFSIFEIWLQNFDQISWCYSRNLLYIYSVTHSNTASVTWCVMEGPTMLHPRSVQTAYGSLSAPSFTSLGAKSLEQLHPINRPPTQSWSGGILSVRGASCFQHLAVSLVGMGARSKSSQVTFIYITLLTIQIVSKQLHNIKIWK